MRWESAHGWTRTGFGRVREQETSLAAVLARLLTPGRNAKMGGEDDLSAGAEATELLLDLAQEIRG